MWKEAVKNGEREIELVIILEVTSLFFFGKVFTYFMRIKIVHLNTTEEAGSNKCQW